MPCAVTLLATVTLSLVQGGSAARPESFSAGAALESASEASRLECFLLTAAPESSEADPAPRAEVGLCAWRRSGEGDLLQLELEVTWFPAARDELARRMLHVERLSPAGARLVWRELGPGAGRCLLAEWSPDGSGLRIVDWSSGECIRGRLDTAGGAVFPLYLLELVRSGQAAAGELPRFDPASRAIDPVAIRTSYETTEDARASGLAVLGTSLRTVELLRGDGSLATRCRFAGTELVSIEWQQDGARARRIPCEEYERRLAETLPARAPGRP